MRHTDPRLTLNTYTDFTLQDTAGAVERLPDLDRRPSADRAAGLKTGTDDRPVQADESIDEKYVRTCPQGVETV